MHVVYSCIATIKYDLCYNSGEHLKLTEVDHEKDLGVWISSDLNLSMQGSSICYESFFHD